MDWGYVAGYFDGEGHVGLHLNTRGGKGKPSGKVRALTWYNTHRESLEAMRAFMGIGRVLGQQRKNRKLPIYTLSITRKSELVPVLDALIPHLIVKREQAIALRADLQTARGESPNFGGVAALSQEQFDRWYYAEQKSVTTIARLLGVSHTAVVHEMTRRGMKRRPANGSHKKGKPLPEATRQKMIESRRRLWADPEWSARQRALMADNRQRRNTQ